MDVVLNQEMAKRERKKQLDEILVDERPRLLNFIKGRLPNIHDAEDVLQDVLVDFSENFLLPNSIQQSSAWLFRAARNKIADAFRKKKHSSFSSVDSEEEHWLDHIMVEEQTAEDAMWNESIAEAIDNALTTLPNEQRDVFVWHEIEGNSFKDIAELTGLPLATLASRKRYAVAALKKELIDIYIDLTH